MSDYDDDIDGDLEDDDEFDGDGVLRDGRSVRVGINFMDAVQRDVALSRHRPGWRTNDSDGRDDAEKEVRDAHAEYCAWLRDAHRTPVAGTAKPQRPASPKKLTLDAARAAAEQAYQERSEWLRNAHKERRP